MVIQENMKQYIKSHRTEMRQRNTGCCMEISGITAEQGKCPRGLVQCSPVYSNLLHSSSSRINLVGSDSSASHHSVTCVRTSFTPYVPYSREVALP